MTPAEKDAENIRELRGMALACGAVVEELQIELQKVASELAPRAQDLEAAKAALVTAENRYVETGANVDAVIVGQLREKVSLATLRKNPIAERHASVAADLESARATLKQARNQLELAEGIADARSRASIEVAQTKAKKSWDTIFDALERIRSAARALDDARIASHRASEQLVELSPVDPDATPLDANHFVIDAVERLVNEGRPGVAADAALHQVRYAIQLRDSEDSRVVERTVFSQILPILHEWRSQPAFNVGDIEHAQRRVLLIRNCRTFYDLQACEYAIQKSAEETEREIALLEDAERDAERTRAEHQAQINWRDRSSVLGRVKHGVARVFGLDEPDNPPETDEASAE